MTIAERAAAARPEDTAGLLIDLWNADQTGTVCPQWDLFRGQNVSVAVGREQEWGKFRSLLEAGAILDAAMMLLPEGWGLTITRYWISESDEPVWSAELVSGGLPDNPRKVFDCYDTPSPALALIAAIAASKGV